MGRYLAQYEGLKSYFLSCDAKVISITGRLENPLTKPILHFLAHVLPSMDRFSRMFQKSSENTTCELYVEMGRLVRLYAGNLLKREVILAAGDKLKEIKMDASSQVTNEHLGIGNEHGLALLSWNRSMIQSLSSLLYENFTYQPLQRC